MENEKKKKISLEEMIEGNLSYYSVDKLEENNTSTKSEESDEDDEVLEGN